MQTKLARITEIAKEKPNEQFTSLYHLLNEELLTQCHRELDGNKAAGVDQVTKAAYEERLEEKVRNLVDKQMKGTVTPLRRKEGLIFRSDDGRPLRGSAVRRTLNWALKKAGIHHIRVHDLRHTAGSIKLDAGESLASVAEFLGQDPATTAAIYTHAIRSGVGVGDIVESDN